MGCCWGASESELRPPVLLLGLMMTVARAWGCQELQS